MHCIEDPLDLLTGEHGGQAFGAFCAEVIKGNLYGLMKDLAVEEKDSLEGLILGRGSDIEVYREMGQKCLHFLRAHVFGMALVVEEDEALDPGDVSFLCADGILLPSNGVWDLFKKFRATLMV